MRQLMFSGIKKVVKKLGGKGFGKIKPLKAVYDSAFSALQPKVLKVHGQKMYLDTRDKSISRELIMNGCYEPFETELIKKTVKPGMVAVDLGANVGYYTLIMARIVGPRGKVYAFEPDPANFALLEKNVEANGHKNVVLVNKAVSNKAGREKLYLSDDNLGGHHLKKRGDYRRSVTVETIVLDKFLGKDAGKVGFVKMDIEGSEPLAIKGMKKILNNRKLQMITENGSGSEVYMRLLLKSFKIFRIDEGKKSTPRFDEDDIPKILAKPAIPGYQNFYCKRQ